MLPGAMQPLDLRGDPASLFVRRGELGDADFFAVGLVRHQFFLGHQRRLFQEARDLARGAQDASGRAVIVDQRLDEARGCGAISRRYPGKPFQKHREASERGAPEAVDRLGIIAHGHDIAMAAGQPPQQLDLRDIGVLEFVHEDVAEALAKLRGELRIGVQGMHGVEQLHAKGQQVAVAQQPVARAIGPRDLALLRDYGFAHATFVLGQHRPLVFVSAFERGDIALVVVGRDQLVLAT